MIMTMGHLSKNNQNESGVVFRTDYLNIDSTHYSAHHPASRFEAADF